MDTQVGFGSPGCTVLILWGNGWRRPTLNPAVFVCNYTDLMEGLERAPILPGKGREVGAFFRSR